MSDLQDDFRATVESVAIDAREIERIEGQKAKLDASDPRARSLSDRAEEIAEQLHHKTLVQRDLTDIAAEE